MLAQEEAVQRETVTTRLYFHHNHSAAIFSDANVASKPPHTGSLKSVASINPLGTGEVR